MTECYVCLEPCTEPAPCACKTMFVHPSCVTIMRMYGQTSCGMCRTPYLGPPVDQIEEDIEEDVQEVEDDEWKPAPCLCYVIPTPIRSQQYDVSDFDKLMDIFRYCFIVIFILMILHFADNQPRVDLGSDLVPFMFLFMFIILFCNMIGQRLQTRPHNLSLRLNHGIQAV